MKKLLFLLLGVMPAFGQTYNRSDGTLQNALGQALSGATVYVCTQPCSATVATPGLIPPSPLASIFSDSSGTAVSTPGSVTTDGNGNFFFYSTLSQFTEVFVYRGRIVKVLPDQVPQGASTAVTAASTVPATPIYATAGAVLTPDVNFGDSTGLGDLFANKSVSVNGTGFVWTFKTQTAPPNPAAGFMEWYGDSSTNKWTCLNSDGSSCGSTGAGSGTVTNFVSGNLAPLFTTSVSTSNTTPTQSFTASTFAAHTFYGNNTGGTATPGAQAITAADLGTGTANSSTFLRGDQTWQPSTGSAPIVVLGSSDTLSAAGVFATTASVTAGSTSFFEIRAHGVYSTTGTASPIEHMRVNAFGTTGLCVHTGGNNSLNINSTNLSWDVVCYVQIVTTGAPGTATTWGSDNAVITLAGTIASKGYTTNAATQAATTTTAQTISIEELATLVAGESFTLQTLIIRTY
jgi:hypothetical protein